MRYAFIGLGNMGGPMAANLARAGHRELRQVRRDVGFVFQQFNIVGRLSALENVLSGALGRLRGPRYGALSYPRALRREALEQLDRVGLGDRAFQRTDTLSGGQQQRVAIARALALRPAVLLLDEPTSALDPELVGEVLSEVQGLARDGMTMIVVTHEMTFARDVGSRIVFMDEGRVVVEGPSREVLANAASNDRLKSFLARIEMKH